MGAANPGPYPDMRDDIHDTVSVSAPGPEAEAEADGRTTARGRPGRRPPPCPLARCACQLRAARLHVAALIQHLARVDT